jgi:hypothetical protein
MIASSSPGLERIDDPPVRLDGEHLGLTGDP